MFVGLDAGAAVQLTVAAVLSLHATAILWSGRWRPGTGAMSLFLVLVALNFGVDGLARTGVLDPVWRRLGLVALAMDPFYLLWFSHVYLGGGAEARRRLTLALSAVLAFGIAGVVTVLPGWLLADPANVAYAVVETSMVFRALVFHVGFAYFVAWWWALRAGREAPTPRLQEQAAWMVAAVGVVALTRFGLMLADLHLTPASWSWSLQGEGWMREAVFFLLVAGSMLVVMAVAWLIGLRWAAGLTIREVLAPRDLLARAMAFVAVFTVAVMAVQVVDSISYLLGGPLVSSLGFYAWRWFAFAPLLAVGVLRFGVGDAHHDASRPLRWAVVGSLVIAGSMATGVALGPRLVADPIALALMVMVAAALVTPARVAADAGLDRLLGPEVITPAARRLELYRAEAEQALEARTDGVSLAWASLQRERRRLGLSREEARVIHHVVGAVRDAELHSLHRGDEPLPGLVLGESMGAGGQGEVFSARHHRLGCEVAVKVLDPERRAGASARRAAVAELRALQNVAHPNVVRLREVAVWRGHLLVVTDIVEGAPLHVALADRRHLDEDARFRILDGIVAGLAAVHRAGVIHGDLKPQNIVVDMQANPVILDFGSARVTEGHRFGTLSFLPDNAPTPGTLSHMAPEQARGEPSTMSSDVFAFGMVALEVLTMQPARELRGLTPAEALEVVQRPPLVPDNLPAPFLGPLRAALATDPSVRPADAQALAALWPVAPRSAVAPAGGARDAHPDTSHRSRRDASA